MVHTYSFTVFSSYHTILASPLIDPLSHSINGKKCMIWTAEDVTPLFTGIRK